jgi:hypothetical protein
VIQFAPDTDIANCKVNLVREWQTTRPVSHVDRRPIKAPSAALRATKPPSDLGDFSYATIVAATVQCVLLNAAQSTEIKYVALRIVGESANRRYGGVFRTARFRNGPSKRVFAPPQ